MIGFAVTGSFCTHSTSLQALKKIIDSGYEVIPIISEISAKTDTRFGNSADLIESLETITHNKCIKSISEAEKLGPGMPLDYLIISPCTGNTLAKMANGITDTTVTMAAKAHLRSSKPLLIALASNDALSANLENIAVMLNKKNVYFVPMFQDNPISKPHSLVADFNLIFDSFEQMKNSIQIRPIFK